MIKEGAVYIDSGKIYVDEAFVNSLFAQDITATGTISGLKLRGSEIDVESTYTYYVPWTEPDGETLYLGAEEAGSILRTGFDIEGAAGHTYLNYWTLIRNTYTDLGGTTYTTEMMMEAGDVRITGNEIHLSSKLVSIAADDLMLDVPCYKNLYTTFDSDVVSSGTVLVVEKMGWCAVTAIVELSSAVSGWTDILTVPAPQHGRNLYTTVPANNSTTIKPLSARIASAGKLQLRYGGAGTYYFELAYPIE